ncbi:MAG: IS3 family transposase [Phascolarctobacterium sp.]|nr:IS3 family transposase [Phascolarctobacterium sp.]
MLNKRNIIQSMSRRGNCLDKAIMESFFGTMKNEMFYGYEKTFKSIEDLKVAMDDYI